ncbi:hypothetical protein CKJ67_23560 [Mycobacterium intracellulare]|nr:hypothetical protein OCU_45300 [Mycobacterium intracellulare ATCC 13950]AFC56175.1 hypothetical protein OCQ_46630 [Mycobacterium paraintracellulare]AFS16645.1 Hypothetical protein MIP_06906 [Mycobacterium intracellulare subsp. intracellulare MTCC 9506]ASQ88426.1 hypothetical protein CE197_24600 [Mycobacterium intracellulare subsp. chimaera]ASW87448.1 hypothetical protein CKJ61_22585 [Mycobacterium intracellulare]ETZ32156.1 hypothetical protein L843_4866 [Mycobacterium intracellulare MIN_061
MGMGEGIGGHERPFVRILLAILATPGMGSGAAKCAATTRTRRAQTRGGGDVGQGAVKHTENLARSLRLFRWLKLAGMNASR